MGIKCGQPAVVICPGTACPGHSRGMTLKSQLIQSVDISNFTTLRMLIAVSTIAQGAARLCITLNG